MCQANGVASGLKYESDGGLGIATIMALFKSSLHPEKDRKQFMQTVFLFWLLGLLMAMERIHIIYGIKKTAGKF